MGYFAQKSALGVGNLISMPPNQNSNFVGTNQKPMDLIHGRKSAGFV